jgi:hypothetical protein
VRTQPEVLEDLKGFNYDVTSAQGKQAEARVAFFLSSLAPRMRFAQDAVLGRERVVLGVDAQEVWQRFQEATNGPAFAGSTLHFWNHPGNPNNPIRTLRNSLPAEEGGVDKTELRTRTQVELIRLKYLPAVTRQLRGEPGQRLQMAFSAPFVDLRMRTRLPHDYLVQWLPGLMEVDPRLPNEAEQRRIPDMLLRERMPRDLILRGRLEEATTFLVAMRRELHRQRGAPVSPLGVQQWCKLAEQVYVELIQAKDAGDAVRLNAAQQQVKALWDQGADVSNLIRATAAEPLESEATYQIALAKQEQAERLQTKVGKDKRDAVNDEARAARSAWTEAAEWWTSYLREPASATGALHARFLKARAVEALGKRDEAVALLEDVRGIPTAVERGGRLYLARQLKAP